MSAAFRPEHQIRTAEPSEARAVAHLIACGFDPIDLTRWLVPDVFDRIPIMASFLHLTVRHAIEYGTVHIVGDLLGASVWLPAGAPDIEDYQEFLKDACGAYTQRFLALDQAMHLTHPSNRAHEYLPFIAVRPEVQGQGLGTFLLDHHHEWLDKRGRPAYLEAASAASIRLYQRSGYQLIQEPFGPAGSTARLYPMWREPKFNNNCAGSNRPE